MFKNGCPKCGYSSVPVTNTQKTKKKTRQLRPKSPPQESMPFHTYIIIAIAILAIVTLFSYFITK
jgi:uncharacterized membrane protein YvbJ